MTRFLLVLPLCATALFLAEAPRAHAESDAIQEIVAILHEAEASPAPLPLLEKAKEKLGHFNPKPALGKIAARQKNAVNAGAAKHKGEAMKALEEAIAGAKAAGPKPAPSEKPALGTAMDKPAGADLKALIENAVAKVHMAGEGRR